MDGGAIQANSRQLIRPARMWTIAAAVAATPEMPMFAPAPAAGWEATSSTAGRRMLPNTSPTTPPARATAKHQAQKAVSSRASKGRAAALAAPAGGALAPQRDVVRVDRVVDPLVAGDPLGRVDAAREAQLVEQLERPVDARDADVLALIAQPVGDLLRGD